MSEVHVYKVPSRMEEAGPYRRRGLRQDVCRVGPQPGKILGQHGKRIDWFTPYTKVKDVSFAYPKVSIRWFHDGVTNVAYNCIDRHLKKRADQVAIVWEGDDPYYDKKITYRELYEHVCRFANVLKAKGVRKGDRVTIYMPMIPETAYAMLACARIGAVHSVVFGGFSPDSLAGRIVDCDSRVLITADEGVRGGRPDPAQEQFRQGGRACRQVRHQGREGAGGAPHRRQGRLVRERDVWYHEAAAKVRRRVPARQDEGGRPAVHPLHLGLDRPAQGRAAHHRRLSRLCRDDPPLRLRLSRRRHVLVHGRCRLGDRPQLHHLRPRWPTAPPP
jgi:hypothetical protein